MVLTHTIDDLDGCEYKVDFEFHKELEGEIVFDWAWDIREIWTLDYEDRECITGEVPHADQKVSRWLKAGGEDTIYFFAERAFK